MSEPLRELFEVQIARPCFFAVPEAFRWADSASNACEDGTSDVFEQGRVTGRREERANIKGIFHDAVSPELSVALLTLAEAEKELRAKRAPEADELAKVTRLIEKVIEKIGASLEPQEVAFPAQARWNQSF